MPGSYYVSSGYEGKLDGAIVPEPNGKYKVRSYRFVRGF